MAILLTFLLGIVNFALHRAVLERCYLLFASIQSGGGTLGGRMSLAAEFAVLLVALLLVANGHTGWGWAYLGYSMFNAATAWFILRRQA